MRSNPEVRSFSRERSGELTERDVVPAASPGGRSQLLVGGGDGRDPASARSRASFRLKCEDERGRIDDDELSPPKQCRLERAQAHNLERRSSRSTNEATFSIEMSPHSALHCESAVPRFEPAAPPG